MLTWTFAHQARWRSLVVWSSLFAGAVLALLFVRAEGPWVGLMQRALICAVSGWLVLVALRVRTIASAGARFRGRTSARLLDGVANQQLGDAVGEPRCVAVRAPTPMSGEAAEDHRIHQQPHGVNGAGSVEP